VSQDLAASSLELLITSASYPSPAAPLAPLDVTQDSR